MHTRLHSRPVADGGLVLSEAPGPAALQEATAVRQVLHDMVRHLSQRLREVVVTRYGLDGNPPAI
ncbi:MAG TPA: hypothetical protein G4N99_08215 [Thermoflexia bacterium]|nr:hypothetical protein [Thermoflexia bacterium]